VAWPPPDPFVRRIAPRITPDEVRLLNPATLNPSLNAQVTSDMRLLDPAIIAALLTVAATPAMATVDPAHTTPGLSPEATAILALLDPAGASPTITPTATPGLDIQSYADLTALLEALTTPSLVLGGPAHTTPGLSPEATAILALLDPAGGTISIAPASAPALQVRDGIEAHPSVAPLLAPVFARLDPLTPSPQLVTTLEGTFGPYTRLNASLTPSSSVGSLALGGPPYIAPSIAPAPLGSLALGGPPYIAPSIAPGITPTGKVSGLANLSATKDSWVKYDDSASPCLLDDANHDGTDLEVRKGQSLGVNTFWDSYIGWNVSSIPAGSTLLRAYLNLSLVLQPNGNVTVNLASIPSADEGWSETTLKCSNRPTFQAETTFNVLATDTTKRIRLPAAMESTLAGRFGGSTTYSLALGMRNELDRIVFDDQESGANAPKLEIHYWAPGDP
jgi:hypothetical protein